jgi:hypothetical protein
MDIEKFTVDSAILDLQKKLGLPGDFFKNLMIHDDWSFVIKLHALIEASCTSLIIYHLDEPELVPIISRLETSNGDIGKLAILKALGLLSENYRKYIRSLSQLRNRLAHNVSNCDFSLSAYVAGMDSNQLKSFALCFSPFENLMVQIAKMEVSFGKKKLTAEFPMERMLERARNDPKIHIWIGAYNLLVHIADMHDYSRFLQENKAASIMYKGDYDWYLDEADA